MAKSSVREYAILYVGGRKKGGGSAAGGNVLLNAGQHALDGPEHTAAGAGTRLDASTSSHGLMPALSGVPSDVLGGDGVFRAESAGGLVPYYIAVDDTFTVPVYKQALFADPIEVDGALVVNGLLIGVD